MQSYLEHIVSTYLQADRLDEQRCDPPDFLSKKESEPQIMVRKSFNVYILTLYNYNMHV